MKIQKLIYRKWYKVMLVMIMFIPVITQEKFDSRYTVNVIAEVLKHPYIDNIGILLPVTKVFLFLAFLSLFFMKKHGEKILLGYYAGILIPVSLFQNMAETQYGFTFVVGNMIIQLLVCIVLIADLVKGASCISSDQLDRTKLWVISLMCFAFMMPYAIQNDIIVPSLSSVLTNEAGVTYCMITPVILGMMILFHRGMNPETMHIAAFVGFSFGILNMMTWFGFQIQNWWMGICHLPLFILSFYALRLSAKKAE